ncbi:unnamed protein product [Caenorhabditis angaria]|uniref:Seven TM Receptor n=1 Tax=Caenorhabditis angaria TaxID=860376 RepID=A0A9P1ISV0_9PELO|nr:unnamed protein product [Caenorhabditis angaria]
MGGYKRLLLLSAGFQLTYSILEVIVAPMVYSYKSMIIVFVETSNSIFDKEITRVLIALYCSCYGFLMGLLTIQFYYRYLVAYESCSLIKTMMNFKIIIWFSIPFCCAFLWFFISYYLCHQTSQANENIRNIFLIDFDTNIDDVIFIGLYLYQKENDGIEHINIKSIIGIIIAIILNMSSMIAIVYFGWKCYWKISSKMLSGNSLQNQLFYALFLDCLIPIIVMHIPVVFLYFSCLLEIDFGNGTSCVSFLVALFPAISPFSPIFIVKNYRAAFINFICCSNKLKNQRGNIDN